MSYQQAQPGGRYVAQDVILSKVIVEVEVQPGRGRAGYIAAAVRHESYPDCHTGPQVEKREKEAFEVMFWVHSGRSGVRRLPDLAVGYGQFARDLEDELDRLRIVARLDAF